MSGSEESRKKEPDSYETKELEQEEIEGKEKRGAQLLEGWEDERRKGRRRRKV